MRKIKDSHSNMTIVYAISQKDVTRYLWEYHKISTDIMKSGQSWYMLVNSKWWGCATKTLDYFPIQHWATIYKWLKNNPESTVGCMPYSNWIEYAIKKSNSITIDHSKYKSFIT
jgi:hypothetical protein